MTEDSQALARRNIFALAAAQALGAVSPPIIISFGGLAGQQLSSDPALVTLPVSLFNLGLAVSTLPAAWQTINWLIFPAVALIRVPLLWQSARTGPLKPTE